MSLVLPLVTPNSISLIRKQVKRNYLNIALLLTTQKRPFLWQKSKFPLIYIF